MKNLRKSAFAVASSLMLLAATAEAGNVSVSYVADNHAIVVLENPTGSFAIVDTAIPSWSTPKTANFTLPEYSESEARECKIHVIAWGDGSVAQGIAANVVGDDGTIYTGQSGWTISTAPNTVTGGFRSTYNVSHVGNIIGNVGGGGTPVPASGESVGTGGAFWGPVVMQNMGRKPGEYPKDFFFVWDQNETNANPADYRIATIPCTAVQDPEPEVVDVPGDHYQCYDIAKAENLKPESIVVADQFGKSEIVLARPVTLCNPSYKAHRKNEYKAEDTKKHYVCYAILKQGKQQAQSVEISNQFQTVKLRIGQRKTFCVPSYKKLLKGKEFNYQ